MKHSVLNPVEIGFLIHCYTFCEVHPRIDSGSVQQGIKKMLRLELICPDEDYENRYVLTECGNALMNLYVRTPLPTKVMRWIDADGDIIDS